MAATSLLLVRHGQSVANVAAVEAERVGAESLDLPQRDADIPLTRVGAAQARALGRWLSALPPTKFPQSVWTSPFLRARETARLTLAGRGDLRLQEDERLRDHELGILEHLTPHGVEMRLPAEAARRHRQGSYYYRPPGGESWADVALRIRSFAEVLDTDDCTPNALVVSHDAVVFLFRVVCESLTETEALALARTPVRNGSVSRLVRSDRRSPWRLQSYNSVDHLVGTSRAAARR